MNSEAARVYTENAINQLIDDLKTKFDIDINIDKPSIPIQSKFSLDDFDTKEALKRKGLTELKDMCKYFKVRYSGKKDDLISRIWGVKYPEEAPLDSKPKKRGRKAKQEIDDRPDLDDDSSPAESPKSNESSPLVSPHSDSD